MISIGMAVRNGAVTIRPAVRSLQLQTWANWELLLIDDGSTDDGIARVRELGDARIRILQDGLQKGLGQRLNEAVAQASGEFFARMDADDICFPERLMLQVQVLQENPRIDLVGATALTFRDDGIVSGLIAVARTHEEICRTPWAGFYLPHPTWLGRMDWFRTWRYDPSMLKAQDTDLLLRSFDTSRFGGLTRPLLGYRQDRSSLGKRLHARSYVARSMVRSGLRRRDAGFLFKGLPLLAAKAAADVLRATVRSDGGPMSTRSRDIDPAWLDEWRRVWRSCAVETDEPCAG